MTNCMGISDASTLTQLTLPIVRLAKGLDFLTAAELTEDGERASIRRQMPLAEHVGLIRGQDPDANLGFALRLTGEQI